MRCYICDTTKHSTGALARSPGEAVGVCRHCGIGICTEHGIRADAPSLVLLCEECAKAKRPHDRQAPA